ncbi:cytochrome b-245 chaperone 1 homolog isoform X2 [Mastacembelus armatus]|uniref:cytochrome b-245 chaperone 1 homolog isoform X2 n=1 Tax=Mastacembelus armatus TaxID=205130 RepID=UPI000E45B38E|nr:cytochrome b-245 chaperone 1 homolog isoform X2 [Mastacembelus armatus]
MGYMTVEKHSSTLLHLKRSPGIRSWSLLVGIASVGLAAAYYSSDSILWKVFYVTGCLFVAMQNMEEWEEAVFDKTKNLIELKTFSLYTLVLTLWRKGQERVVLDLTQLCDICVQEEKVRYLGKGYLLMLQQRRHQEDEAEYGEDEEDSLDNSNQSDDDGDNLSSLCDQKP